MVNLGNAVYRMMIFVNTMTIRITMYHDSDDMTMIATIKPGDDEEM